jgi:hypothetical protein
MGNGQESNSNGKHQRQSAKTTERRLEGRGQRRSSEADRMRRPVHHRQAEYGCDRVDDL